MPVYALFTSPEADPPRSYVAAQEGDALPQGSRSPTDLSLAELRADPSTLSLATRLHSPEGLRVSSLEVLSAPPPRSLCYVLSLDPHASPPEATLSAFPLPSDLPPGAVLAAWEATRLGLHSKDALASLRWWPASGQAADLVVAPAARRHRLATHLAAATGLLAAAHDWPSLHGGTHRTPEGDALLASAPASWAPYLEPLTTPVSLVSPT